MKKNLILNENKNKFELEAFKILRTNLIYQSNKLAENTFIITSSISGEGKSFVTANLGVLLSKANKKVLIIDTDIENGIQNKIFEVENNHGFSNCIVDNKKDTIDKYINKTKYKNLYLLTSGKKLGNTSDIIESVNFNKIIENVKEDYDFILIDTKAVGTYSDDLSIVKDIKQVVLVVGMNKVETEILNNTKELIGKIGANIVGYIVNRVPEYKISKYIKNFNK